MDLRQLRYVVAVASLGGFTRAAESLHVAQPALSLAVRQLETELGIRLFNRTSRRVSQTDAGVAFVARAGRILREVDGVAEEMAAFSGAVRGTVRAAIWYHLDRKLPGYLHEFMVANPGIRFTFVELPADTSYDELRAGSLDFGVVGMSAAANTNGLEGTILHEEPMILAVSRDHPLAQEQSIPISRLGEVPMIMGPAELMLRKTVDQMLAGAGVTPEIVLETRSTDAALAYASLGIGGVVLPRSAIEDIGRPVVMVAIDGAPTYKSVLYWNPTAYRRPAAALALAYVQSLVDRDSPPDPAG